MGRPYRTNPDPTYKVGELIRYDDGSSALMVIRHITPGEGRHGAYYHGDQCCGGVTAAYHNACERPNEADRKTWKECAKWRRP